MPEPAPTNALKYRLPVRIALAGGPAVVGWVSLSRHAEFHSGPQTLLERLNEDICVVPVVEGDVTWLVTRALIEYVEPDPGVTAALVGPSPFAVTAEEQASVRLRSGEVLEGIIEMEMPAGKNRTSDFINGAGDFFALRCGQRTLLVNKRRVRDVRLDAAGVKPAA